MGALVAGLLTSNLTCLLAHLWSGGSQLRSPSANFYLGIVGKWLPDGWVRLDEVYLASISLEITDTI